MAKYVSIKKAVLKNVVCAIHKNRGILVMVGSDMSYNMANADGRQHV